MTAAGDGYLVASDRYVGLELVLDEAEQIVALTKQPRHVDFGWYDEADLGGFHDGRLHLCSLPVIEAPRRGACGETSAISLPPREAR